MAVPGAGSTSEGAALAAWVLRLALGRTGDEPPPRPWWPALFDTAFRERCAALAWLKSGAFIRSHAPTGLVERWRGYVVALTLRGDQQLTALHETVELLARDDCPPVVLKGIPLAQRLYGAHWVRAAGDLDVYVPPARRRVAAATIRSAGWNLRHADAAEETYAREGPGGTEYLELHSSLLPGELSHLPETIPDVEWVSVDHTRLPAHGGSSLLPHLCVHAAKHQLPPLIWFVDIATVLGSVRLRPAAPRAAPRLAGYVRWAEVRAWAVERAVSGDADALRLLGYGRTGRRDRHPLFRDVSLAATPLDAARALGAWLWPRTLRSHPAALSRRWAHRVRGLARYGAAREPNEAPTGDHQPRRARARLP